MRKDTQLRGYKIAFITDRTDLQTQLEGTAQTTDETVYVADSIEELKELLKTDTSNIIMGMMQKSQEKDKKEKSKFKPLPLLNRSDKILLLIDEAHRTQSSLLAASLANALPNCTKIAFTGTPLITERVKKKTTETFGEYIDKYTIEQSVKDGSTLQILYEGRTSKDAIKDGKTLDDIFEDMFKEYTKEERELLQRKYGTKTDVLEAPKRIEVIARDIIEQYRKNIMPNGFKAQVVTTSRLAAMRYKEALDKALKEVIERLEKEPAQVQKKEELETIKRLKTSVIISSDHNDPPEYYPYTDRTRQDRDIERFKKPLKSADPEKQSGIAFLIVKDMLITGFDAPVEQVMDIVLPNPAALPYVQDMKTFGFINISAKNRYRDDNLNIAGCGEKVRKLIDEYVLSMGIDPKIPPISIVAEDFDDYIVHKKSAKARASEMEHAIRFHISKHLDLDPEFYQKLSEKLEEILAAQKENWEDLAGELKTFLEEVRAGRKEEDDGLDPVIEKPFYDILVKEVYDNKELTDKEKGELASIIIDIVSVLKREIDIVDFWKKHPEKKRLSSYIISILVKSRLPEIIKKKDNIATRFMSLAEKLDSKLKE